MSDKKQGKSSSNRVNIHEARIIDMVQKLRETNSVITVRDNNTGRPLKYGDGDETELSIKDFLRYLWPSASENTITEYCRSEYDLEHRETDYKNILPAHRKILDSIKLSFCYNRGLENCREKDDYYFSNQSPIVDPINESYPYSPLWANILEKITAIERYEDPAEKVMFIFFKALFSGIHWDKQLEKKISNYLTNNESVFAKLANSLDMMSKQYKTRFKTDGNFYLLAQYHTFSSLYSKSIDYDLQQSFENAFKNESKWFNGQRFEKLTCYREKLIHTPVEKWPEGFIDHVVFAVHERISIHETLKELIEDEIKNIGFKLFYSKDNQEISVTNKIVSIKDLVTTLSEYNFDRSKLVHKISENGTLLKTSLKRLPKASVEERDIDKEYYQAEIKDLIRDVIAKKLRLKTGFREELF